MIAFRNRITAMASMLMLLGSSSSGLAFTPRVNPMGVPPVASESVVSETMKEHKIVSNVLKTTAAAALASMIFFTGPALADEFGRETEAPTFFTGETQMVRFWWNMRTSNLS